MSEWQCEVCNYQGNPTNIKENKEEWRIEVECECPHCESTYLDGEVMNRAEGECCDFCGEFVDEVVEVYFGGSKSDRICLMCKECE